MHLNSMKTLSLLAAASVLAGSAAWASEESKAWPASEKAKLFVQDTVAIGFFASPWGTGWTEDAHTDGHDRRRRSEQGRHLSRRWGSAA